MMLLLSHILPFVHGDWFWLSFDAINFKHHVESSFEHLKGSFVGAGEIGLCQEPIEGGDVCVNVTFVHGEFL